MARQIADLCLDKKALDIVVLDGRGSSSYTDFLVIASATSDRQVQAIADHVSFALRETGTRPLGVEGLREGQWALVDFGGVVLHVFHQFARQAYALETLWPKAPRLPVTPPVAVAHQR